VDHGGVAPLRSRALLDSELYLDEFYPEITVKSHRGVLNGPRTMGAIPRPSYCTPQSQVVHCFFTGVLLERSEGLACCPVKAIPLTSIRSQGIGADFGEAVGTWSTRRSEPAGGADMTLRCPSGRSAVLTTLLVQLVVTAFER
jgi:hypothetical protein